MHTEVYPEESIAEVVVGAGPSHAAGSSPAPGPSRVVPGVLPLVKEGWC